MDLPERPDLEEDEFEWDEEPEPHPHWAKIVSWVTIGIFLGLFWSSMIWVTRLFWFGCK